MHATEATDAAAPEDARADDVIRWQELAGTVLGAVLLTGAMGWRLLRDLGHSVTGGDIDPLAQSYFLSWTGHAARTDAGIWDANVFYPAEDSLAFSDSMLGYLPFNLIGSGPEASLVRYNLVLLFTFVLCFVAGTLLTRELGVRQPFALVGGTAFAFAPWRVAHLLHMNVLSLGGVALTVFFLLRGYRLRRPGLIVAGWLTAAWQLSIGFAMGIYFSYALAVLALVVLAFWFRDGRPDVSRGVVGATVGGGGAFLAAAALLAKPYLEVLDRYPDAERTVESLRFFSPPVSGLLAAPYDSVLWGDATKAVRSGLDWPIEHAVFPGVALVSLAGFGLLGSVLTRRMRLVLVLGVAVTTVLALGTSFLGGRLTAIPLFEHAPGWQGLRTPGRLFGFTALCLALLAAAGAQAATSRLSADRPLDSRARHAVVAAIVALLWFEGLSTFPLTSIPDPPTAWGALPAPAVHLPTDLHRDAMYMHWATAGYPDMTNGVSSFLPPELAELRRSMETFPSAESIEQLRALGVLTVVLHTDRVEETPWETTVDAPLGDLPLEREQQGSMVIYHVAPA